MDGSLPAELFCTLLVSVEGSIGLSDIFGPPGYDGGFSYEFQSKFILLLF